jgi:hypothetical protein
MPEALRITAATAQYCANDRDNPISPNSLIVTRIPTEDKSLFEADFAANLILKTTNKLSIETERFIDHLKSMSWQCLDVLWTHEPLADHRNVLLMDVSPKFVRGEISLCNRTSPMSESRITSIFKALDLSVFAVLDKCRRYHLLCPDHELLAQLLNGRFTQISHERYGLLFDEKNLKQRNRLKLMSVIDSPFEHLSRRQRDATCHWINNPDPCTVSQAILRFDGSSSRYRSNCVLENAETCDELKAILEMIVSFPEVWMINL